MRLLLILLLAQVPLGLDRGWLAPPENPVTREKVALGRSLFFDPILSADRTLSCAGCHRPELSFSDARRVSIGVGGRRGTRNTPAIVNRTYGRAFFWDGRIATLETQVLQPIIHPDEMGAELSVIVERLRSEDAYRSWFAAVFGRSADVEALSHALASYVRTIRSGGSRYDAHEAGDIHALAEQEKLGLAVFRGRGRCTTCHIGPNFTDEAFHNTGVSWGTEPYDAGRALVTGRVEETGKFKTPTLREVARTAPYMHDGSLATLEDVVEFYSEGGNANPYQDHRIQPLRLSDDEKAALVAFLKTLNGVR